jgi:uncharacterized protein
LTCPAIKAIANPFKMNPAHLRNVLSEFRAYLEQEYGDRLAQVILFGSQARGDAQPDSDVDVLIVLHGLVDIGVEIERTSQFIGALCLNNNIVISRIFTSSSCFQTENAPLFKNVRREGIIL